MQNLKTLKVKNTKSHLVVNYNGSPFIQVSKDVLADYLTDLPSSSEIVAEEVKKKSKKKVKKKKSKKQVIDKDVITKATKLAKQYTSMKKKFYNSKAMRGIKPNTIDFEHCIKAVDIINRHEAKIKEFLKAQVSGLSFVNGTGIFPKVLQLSTDSAETRLLEYRRKMTYEVELTDAEMKLGLQDNKKYKKLHEKITNGTATLYDALYVKECQYARRGKVQDKVEDYIKTMKKKV